MDQTVSAKQSFMNNLNAQVRQAEETARKIPDNQRAWAMACYLKELRDEVAGYDECHALFRHWQREHWSPLTVSDDPFFVRVA
ncbi:MAG: hypothetical protein JJU31_01770 [Wenzhouxiangella sp.]|nr:hypothetical protein [Wenzhouxiangella sp.]MCH8477993.1 hypothetical protein [Wenzhouxiangella sp.]TVR95475.1 MAG: hypothetical protein EA418_07640 [Wenzhouxiangellaceae bacterium]